MYATVPNSQGVLNTMETVRKRLKPGVAWPDMHRLADRCNLEALSAQVWSASCLSCTLPAARHMNWLGY